MKHISLDQAEEIIDGIEYHLDFVEEDISMKEINCCTCCDPNKKFLTLVISWNKDNDIHKIKFFDPFPKE